MRTDPVVSVIYLLLAPVADELMKLGCQDVPSCTVRFPKHIFMPSLYFFQIWQILKFGEEQINNYVDTL